MDESKAFSGTAAGRGQPGGSEVRDFGQPVGPNTRQWCPARGGERKKTRAWQRQNWPKVRDCPDLATE